MENEKWLGAHYDPLASLFTFSQCMVLTDVTGDGENRLVVADLGSGSFDMKLKVFRGTNLAQENTIIDLPTAVVSVFLDQNEPRTPAVAVASGPCVYVYKNMRPYFKFTLPALEVHPVEEEAWSHAKDDRIDHRQLREILDNLRNEGGQLTVRSMRLLQVASDQIVDFVNLHKTGPLKRQTVATCMTTLKKTHPEDDAISCLAIGTESQQIHFLDPEAFTVLSTVDLPATPIMMAATGLYDVEFRILVACRDGRVYQVKRGDKAAVRPIDLHAQPLGLMRVGKNFVVGCADDTLKCYALKGKRLWTVKLPAALVTTEALNNASRNLHMVLAALADSTVRIYRDKYLVDTIQCEDVVSAMIFGRYGREDNTLLMATKNGGFMIKLMKRSAQFPECDVAPGPPAAQFEKLNIPKKTKLFVDQSLRERENAVGMHRQFMRDLYRVRLSTARNFVEALETRANPVSIGGGPGGTPGAGQDMLKLSAAVQGIGPVFLLSISLQNTSMTTASQNLFLTFSYDNNIYKIERGYLPVPYLVPGVVYKFSTYVECLNDRGIADVIKVYVVKEKREVPIITAVINMPVSESVVVV